MEIFVKALQLILSLSILVIIHELGHFIPAKLFKTRVEKFYLFFNPWFSLFKTKKGETEYGIGWLPLGGYVKIAGMIDESMDKEQMASPPQPWEFRSKPAWQRLIIMTGGVIFNILLAIIIYAGMLFVWGEEYLPAENAKYGIVCDSAALKIGLKNGDKVIAVDGKKIDDFRQIQSEIIMGPARRIEVERDGVPVKIEVPTSFIKEVMGKRGASSFIAPRILYKISEFVKGMPAEKSGLKKGDIVVAVDGLSTPYFDQVQQVLSSNKEKELNFSVLRNNDTISVKIKVDKSGVIGVYTAPPSEFLKFEKINYSFFSSFPAGVKKASQVLSVYVRQFKLIFNRDVQGYKHIGGFITIGKIFPSTWDWQAFWSMTALLSVMLAFMNILPIPALDGGHVLFTLAEIVTGRKPSLKFLEYAQIVGMVLLIGLMLYANGNDLIRLFTD